MKKNLLILYSKNPKEIYNRMSALGSYIHVLSGLLETDYNVFLNGTSKKEPLNFDQYPGIKTSGIKKLIPKFIKRIINDILLFRRNDFFTNSITGDYDLILEFYSYGSVSGFNIAKKINIPLIIVYDAPLIDEYVHFNGTKPFFKRKIEKVQNKTLNLAQSIVVYSKPVQFFLEKTYNIKTNFFVHQNIDYTRFEFFESRNFETKVNIGFIGSFLKWHRVDLLIDAFTLLKEKGINADLYLIGTGLEFMNMKNKVETNKFKENIIFTGFLDGKQLVDYKKIIQIGVMPSSNWYGAPNKVFEYGAAKMAVVAPKTPTIESILPEETICLFENNSMKELYLRLYELCLDETLVREKSENLFQFVKSNYSPEITSNFYKKILADTLCFKG